MTFAIDLQRASLILKKAHDEASKPNDELSKVIEEIIRGSHKTYRYVLVNALLAKATNTNINALSLQKGDGTRGKFDARSLCHKVLVPFEMEVLPGSLGGSNEPFLNKPARFVSLSTTNAVRSGKDKEILSKLIDTLSDIPNSEVAYRYLTNALFVMKEIHDELKAKYTLNSHLDGDDTPQQVLDYIYSLLDYKLEGEICPLIVSELERLNLGENYVVCPHKVNQSGASSKEVGDIDIYKSGKLIHSIEVKDKRFSRQDVKHAISKFKQAGLRTSMFIYGKGVRFDERDIADLLKEEGDKGHYCCLISILTYVQLRLYDLDSVLVKDFVQGLLNFSKTINAKDETVNLIKKLFNN